MSVLIPPYVDIIKYHIIPMFSTVTTNIFGQVSKAAHGIIESLANSNQEDINLEGKTVSKTPGSIRAYLLQKFKVDAFNESPEFKLALQRARKELTLALKKRDDLNILFGHAHTIVVDPTYQANLANALVLMGLNGPNKKPSECLDSDMGEVLVKAVKEKNHRIVQAALFHPNTINIPASGIFSLGAAINVAIANENFEDARKILCTHPNAVKIPAEDGVYGLSAALISAIKLNHAELTSILLALPNAANIPIEGDRGLVAAIALANQHANKEIISFLTDHLDKIQKFLI